MEKKNNYIERLKFDIEELEEDIKDQQDRLEILCKYLKEELEKDNE